MAATPRNFIYSILLGLVLVGLADGVRVALKASFGTQSPLIAFFVAVTLAAVFGGYGAGIVALVGSALIGWWSSASTVHNSEQRAAAITICGLNVLIAASLRHAVLLAREALLLAREREAKVRRLVEANIIGIVIWNQDGRVTEANDAFLALVGYDREDLMSGRVRWTDRTPAEWRDADRRAMDQLSAGGVAQPFEKEYIRSDGSRVPVLVGPAAFSGTQEGVAFVLDLSEQKKSEGRLKLMVDELNHRVKNTLATVISISAQSKKTATSVDAFHQAFQERLAALSTVHNLLNETFWTGVGLRGLAERVLAPHATKDRVVIGGEDVRLGPIAAVTLGMALYELASNAEKYGALSTPSGQVRVTWRPGAPGRLNLDWEELGGPPVQPPSRRGFGSQLIERILAGELRGEVRLEFPPQGARCTMDMALDRVSAH
jgi:PAS domain S-box-containing protein